MNTSKIMFKIGMILALPMFFTACGGGGSTTASFESGTSVSGSGNAVKSDEKAAWNETEERVEKEVSQSTSGDIEKEAAAAMPEVEEAPTAAKSESEETRHEASKSTDPESGRQEENEERVNEPSITCETGDAKIEGKVTAVIPAGTEMIENGTFDSADAWVTDKKVGWTIRDGKVYCDGSQSSMTYIYQQANLTKGVEYTIKVNVSSVESGSLQISLGGYEATKAITEAGVYTLKLKPVNAKENGRVYIMGDASFVGAIDSISVVSEDEGVHTLYHARVSIGGCSTETDERGLFTLSNIAESERAAVNFESDGYLRGSFLTEVRSDSPNYVEYRLVPVKDKEVYAGDTRMVLSSDDAEVIIPAGTYTQESISAAMTYLDPFSDEGKAAFPGSFKGTNENGEEVLFVSYGFIDFGLENHTVVADGATVVFPANGKLTKESVALWYYDSTKGAWKEEGYAVRQDDGTYKGIVTRTGSWCLGLPVNEAPGVYRARVVYEDGTPAENVRVYAVGANWVSEDLSTDENGYFEIEVVPGEEFTLKAYDYKNRYAAVYNDTIGGIESGETFEDKK